MRDIKAYINEGFFKNVSGMPKIDNNKVSKFVEDVDKLKKYLQLISNCIDGENYISLLQHINKLIPDAEKSIPNGTGIQFYSYEYDENIILYNIDGKINKACTYKRNPNEIYYEMDLGQFDFVSEFRRKLIKYKAEINMKTVDSIKPVALTNLSGDKLLSMDDVAELK